MSSLAAIIAEMDAADVWPAGLTAALASAREPTPHLSASALGQFMRCPEQFRRVRLRGERERPAAALVWGSADHAAHEVNFRQKIESGLDIPERELQEAFADAFHATVERNGGAGEVDWGDTRPGELLDRGVELASVYHRVVSPRLRPAAVEERFEVPLDGLPVSVLGYVDVRAEVAAPQPSLEPPVTRAVERKTASRAQRTVKPEWRLQGLLYQSVTGLPVDWHVSVKGRQPAVLTPAEEAGLALPHSARAAETALSLVANAARAIHAYYVTYGPDEPWPGAVTHPWSCDFCGFRSRCAWWRGVA